MKKKAEGLGVHDKLVKMINEIKQRRKEVRKW